MTPPRSPELNEADAPLLARLEAALGHGGVRRDVEARYLEEPRGLYRGEAAAVLRPDTTHAVARAVRLCAEARVGIVPYAGGTGLVGGQIRAGGAAPLILSLERMRRIRDVDPVDNVLVAEAGVVLAAAQEAARGVDRLFPLSLASEGTARIGGLMATNAGGVNVLRYGNARDLCLGIEAVTADGRIVNGLTRMVKDNMGFDLRHLLIGSEGTLGIITAASLRLYPISRDTAAAWITVPDPVTALALLQRMRDGLGATISAFELIHRQGLDFVAETLPQIPLPVPAADLPDWMVLTEVADGAGARIAERFETVLAEAFEAGEVRDALIAQSAAQRDAFWAVREHIPEANRRVGAVASHDISLPASQLGTFLARADAAMAEVATGLRVNCFGHLGDGNLHYNLFPPKGASRSDYARLRPQIVRAIHDVTHALGGSVGAEHGVGRSKTADLARYGDPGKLAMMWAIKDALDPLGILNPGAVLGVRPAAHGETRS